MSDNNILDSGSLDNSVNHSAQCDGYVTQSGTSGSESIRGDWCHTVIKQPNFARPINSPIVGGSLSSPTTPSSENVTSILLTQAGILNSFFEKQRELQNQVDKLKEENDRLKEKLVDSLKKEDALNDKSADETLAYILAKEFNPDNVDTAKEDYDIFLRECEFSKLAGLPVLKKPINITGISSNISKNELKNKPTPYKKSEPFNPLMSGIYPAYGPAKEVDDGETPLGTCLRLLDQFAWILNEGREDTEQYTTIRDQLVKALIKVSDEERIILLNNVGRVIFAEAKRDRVKELMYTVFAQVDSGVYDRFHNKINHLPKMTATTLGDLNSDLGITSQPKLDAPLKEGQRVWTKSRNSGPFILITEAIKRSTAMVDGEKCEVGAKAWICRDSKGKDFTIETSDLTVLETVTHSSVANLLVILPILAIIAFLVMLAIGLPLPL